MQYLFPPFFDGLLVAVTAPLPKDLLILAFWMRAWQSPTRFCAVSLPLLSSPGCPGLRSTARVSGGFKGRGRGGVCYGDEAGPWGLCLAPESLPGLPWGGTHTCHPWA